MMIAEITYRSTGLGIEMGWVNDLGKPIICLIKSGNEISDSIRIITDTFIEYNNAEDLKEGLKKAMIRVNGKSV